MNNTIITIIGGIGTFIILMYISYNTGKYNCEYKHVTLNNNQLIKEQSKQESQSYINYNIAKNLESKNAQVITKYIKITESCVINSVLQKKINENWGEKDK